MPYQNRPIQEGTTSLSLQGMSSDSSGSVINALEQRVVIEPTAEAYLDLSLHYWSAGRFRDCIAASHKALALRPQYAEAYNNISAAYHSMGEWDAAIAAATEALRIAPNYRLAKNNLAQSLAEKKKSRQQSKDA